MTRMLDAELTRLSRDIRNLNARPLWERTTRMGPGSAARTGTASEFAAAIEEQRAKIAAIHRATEKKSAQ